MSWYKIVLTRKQVARQDLAVITDLVGGIRLSRKDLRGFNGFLGKEKDRSLVTVYFPPDAEIHAEELMKNFKATPCEKPALKDLSITLFGQRVTEENFPID